MNIATQYDGLPTVLVEEGMILTDALRSMRLTKAWLQHQLRKQNIHDISQISMAQLDTKGNLYVDLMGDQPSFIISTSEEKGDQTQ